MIKILLTVAVLSSVGSLAGLAMAQGKQGEASGSEVSSQCAHRRMMPPDPRNNCFGRGGASTTGAGPGSAIGQGIGTGQGIGPGNGPGNGGGQGIGPGNGGGQAKGRQ
jgi:hypothetical protein